MLRSVVFLAGLAVATAFTSSPAVLNGMALKNRGACQTATTMQMDRRQLVQSAAAALLSVPAAAFASTGDFPKVAIFGSAPISAPFGDVYGTAGSPVWSKLQDTERGIYERILGETKKRLQEVETYISQPSWEEARRELRLATYETRKAMLRLTDVSDSADSKALYEKFKKQIEVLDLALAKKDADTSFRLRAAADITYGQWLASVGL